MVIPLTVKSIKLCPWRNHPGIIVNDNILLHHDDEIEFDLTVECSICKARHPDRPRAIVRLSMINGVICVSDEAKKGLDELIDVWNGKRD